MEIGLIIFKIGMGNCWQEGISNPSQIKIQRNSISSTPLLAEQISDPSQIKILSNSILNTSSLGRQLVHMLNGVSFTANQAKDIAKGLINGIITLQRVESEKEREEVKSLFNQINTKKIAEGQLFYFGMLDKLNKPISQVSNSRIYHGIANLKKGQTIGKKVKNKWGIICFKSNDYNKLSESQLQQVVKYESIADKTRQIGQKLGFKFHSIQKQSQKMTSLLIQCIQKHIQVINQLKYDLSEPQVMKVAQISRQACNYYDNGAYILLVYLVQSCKKLQQKSKTIQQIEVLVKKAIDDISQKYPPGQGLSKQNQGLINKLKQLQNPKNYQQVSFNHEETKLTSSNKQEQVQKIIENYAKIAEQSKQLFQELVKNTCIAKCVYFKIGLKYYPNNPNIKALTRIKEKMFFKKDSKQQSKKKVIGGNIKDVLQEEQIAYRTIIDEILKNTDKVEFKISDMVRGKCIFMKVGDIIQCVNEIKEYASKNPRIGIKEIESRFTNPMPISDVTLKIVLDNKIVAELQLTIQTNAATYNFAHKIYQLQRTKVFSKLKITHNYFQESTDDFSQLAQKAMELQAPKFTITSTASNSISKYFKLGSEYKSFSTILQETIEENKRQLKQLSVSVDPLLQDLILVAFDISIGLWGKEIGKVINKTLKNEQLSPKLKSVALSIFLDKLQLQKESQNMQQLGIPYDQLGKKIYIEEYMKEYFQIQSLLRYAKQNQRVFCRAQQLQQIIFFMYNTSQPIQLKDVAFVDNLALEERCLQKIKRLKEIFSFYFITRKENKMYESFQKYTKWIQDQFKFNSNTGIELLKNEIEIISSQYKLEKNNPNEASKSLQQSLQVFKGRQKYSKAMQCQILLAECYIKINKQQNLRKCIDYYTTNVKQKAQILGQQLKGVLYADSLWRISEYLWDFVKTDEKRQLLQSFTSMAISQMSRCKGIQFIYALKERWKSYDNLKNLQKPQIKPNPNLKYAKLKNLRGQGCQYLQIASWKNITTLMLEGNNIGAVGCQHLSKADWKNITMLNLDDNKIGAVGCQHLSKADWKNITTLYLDNISFNTDNNEIGDGGCQHLSKADWKNITTLYLDNNEIGDGGCQHLSKADWKNITTLYLGGNNIGDGGCQRLSKADWKNITMLYIGGNNIGDGGCQHLSKADWKNMTRLYLEGNNIGDGGCQHLSKADWKNITILYLDDNEIGDGGCQHLSKANWKNITMFFLENNQIGAVGCKHLSKANWICLQSLDLQHNQVPEQQKGGIKLLFTQKDLRISI